jgi:GNAT superfamily N-acetyltransferase
MKDEFLGERRKGLEEAYFAKHNRELIEHLRKGIVGPPAPEETVRPDDGVDVTIPDDRTSRSESSRVHARGTSDHVLERLGIRVTLRPLRPSDRAQYEAFLASLEPEDLRLRFGRPLEQLIPDERARLRNLDDKRDIALIATASLEPGSWQVLGEARARADEYGGRSEFAITVRSGLKRLGLGRALLKTLIEYCDARKIRMIYGLVTPTNLGMLGLARSLGFEIDHIPGGMTVVVSLDVNGASVRSRRQSGARSGQTVTTVCAA